MPVPAPALAAALLLHPCHLPGIGAEVRCGTYAVPEDRAHPEGRRISLDVVVLPSRAASPAPDPLFVVSYGGPGATNTENAPQAWQMWWRDARDVVLVDLRGTNGPSRLDCPAEASEATLQADLDTLLPPEKIRRCRERLSKIADLTQYTTAASVDDLDEVRAALGYERINLWGYSWGARAALIYLRRHPQHIRSVILEGMAALSMKNPLNHARGAQQALDRVFGECDAQPSCKAAFPRLREELAALMQRLHEKPAEVTLNDPETGVATKVQLTWQRFAEGLRLLSYRLPQQREIPRLLHRAAGGDLVPFAEAAAASNRSIRGSIRLGNLLSITCTEDLARIGPGEVERESAGTYLGDSRVREQLAACEGWPRGPLDPGYADPVRSNVPVFLISGTLDPVTPPMYSAETAKTLSRSVNVVAPGAHVPGGPCIESMEKTFLQTANPKAVDQRCVKEMKLPPLAAP